MATFVFLSATKEAFIMLCIYLLVSFRSLAIRRQLFNVIELRGSNFLLIFFNLRKHCCPIMPLLVNRDASIFTVIKIVDCMYFVRTAISQKSANHEYFSGPVVKFFMLEQSQRSISFFIQIKEGSSL